MRQIKGMLWVLLGVLLIAGAAAVTMDNIRYSVKQDSSGKWYVVNERNQRLPIQAKAKDMIFWTAEGADMKFTFPKESNFIFEKEDGSSVPSEYVEEVKDGKTLRLRVKDGAPTGTYEYKVQIGDSVAYGSSPPILIIR